MLRPLVLVSLLAFPSPGVADTRGAIAPYTQQNWDSWQQKMQAADAAIAGKLSVDQLLKALEEPEKFHAERSQVLKRHPDYAAGLERLLALRLKLVTLYANVGHMYAKTAATQKNATLLTQPGGAYERLEQAKVALEGYQKEKGAEDPEGRKLMAYLTKVRGEVDGFAAQLGSTGTSVIPQSKTPVDKGTAGYFKEWWEKLDAVDQALAANDAARAQGALRSAQDHQKGWNGWLVKHSEYARVLARQTALEGRIQGGAVDAELKEALAMARKAAAEKNPNYFGPNGGPAQKIGNARRALEASARAKGESDPSVVRQRQAIDAAAAEIEKLGADVKRELVAARKMPTDTYAGRDKEAIRQQMLAYWKQRYPQDKVLGIRFFEANWTRETNWKANATSIYKSDYSWLPAKVVVRSSDEIATLYPIFANKQHQNDDKMIVSDDRAGNAFAVSEMLMKNVAF